MTKWAKSSALRRCDDVVVVVVVVVVRLGVWISA